MSEFVTISLRKLVGAGCLSKCTFSFDHDSEKCDFVGTKNVRCLNASKLSLLLAQTLVRFDNGRCDDESIGIDFTSLKLDNCFVKLACSSSSNISALDDVICDDNPVMENDDVRPLDFKIDQFDDIDESRDFLSEFFDIIDDGSEHNKIESLLETSEESSSVGADQGSSFGNESFRDQSSLSSDRDRFDSINAASGREIHWTLLGMEIRVHENSSSPTKTLEISQTRDLQKMQHLGRMIYEVFSFDNQTLPSIFKNLLVLDESGTYNESSNESDLRQRIPKLQRYKEKSLFSDLLEVGHYPLSVCRLLSDMIDIFEDEMADVPFTKLEDVIEDLEQMSSHPSLHLDDPEDGLFSSNLRFGLGCYGRVGQVTSILGVTSSLEGNNGRESPHSPECIEGIFVSGPIAGCGKTFLIQSIGNYLTSQGWIVLSAKFEMGLEHESRDVVSAAFNKLVNALVNMRDGEVEKDVEYALNATKAIANALDRDSMSSLANFLPSIKELVDDIDENHSGSNDAADSDKGNSHWRLVFLLSSLLGAVLSLGEFVFPLICMM